MRSSDIISLLLLRAIKGTWSPPSNSSTAVVPSTIIPSPTPIPSPNQDSCGDIMSPSRFESFCGSSLPITDLVCQLVIPIVNATQAWDCLRSVPFHADVASSLIEYLNDTIKFQSTLAYLANPPPDYQQPSVDLLSQLAQVKRDIDVGNFTSQYQFESTVHAILSAAHDDHLSMQGGILSTYRFMAPFSVVSLSRDGIELPKLYIADQLPTDGWDGLDEQPSPIVKINDHDAVEYMTQFAVLNSYGKLEPHADWNMLMRSGALDSQGRWEVFYGGAITYPGDVISIVFEDDAAETPPHEFPWRAYYIGPPNTGPLETGGDFYNFFVLGNYPASFIQSYQNATPATGIQSSNSNSDWDLAYPTPEWIPGSSSDDNELPRVFFLNESSIAVLVIPQFMPDSDMQPQFIRTVATFLSRSKTLGLKKVIIDVQQNTGGEPLLAIKVFKMFFPSIDPFSGSRRRVHPMADALGSTITPYWENLTSFGDSYYYLLSDEWMIADRLDSITGQKYSSWDDYYLSRNTYNGDNFTKVERYNLTNAAFTCAASSLVMDEKCESRNTGYAAEDIIILSDGLCSSACALFMELMHHEAGVRTVVVGGRPDSSPMQAPSGTRGAASYDNLNMDFDISNAHAVNRHDTVLAINRDPTFRVSQATVNLRDQVRRDDPSNTPLQFRYQTADCRIFFTPSTWYNFSNLWNYAAEATWYNRTLCVAKSTTNLTDHISPSATSKTQSCSPQQEDTCVMELGNNYDATYEILDSDDPFTPQNLVQCDMNARDCEWNHVCREIPVCHKGQEKPVNEPRCLSKCSNSRGSTQGCGPNTRCVPLNFTGSSSSLYHSSGSSPDLTTKPNSRETSLPRNSQNHYSGYCKPPPRRSCPSGSNDLQTVKTNLVSPGTDNDDPTTLPCLKDLQDAYVHCFVGQPGYYKCVFYLNTGASSFQTPSRSCSSSNLHQWCKEKSSGNASYHDFDALGYYQFPEQGPAFIVLHDGPSHDIPDFNDLLFDSNLATKVHPMKDWPVDYIL
ncbi:hypothetical protein N7528_007354 [Penicillium herquei]|nr:hypothetical protein N7528_007354 [Penicillium herquei]